MNKRHLLFFLLLLLTFSAQAQPEGNTDAETSLGNASLNVSSGINSFNLADLKYHAKLSKKAILNVISGMKTIKCKKGLNISNDISSFLDKAIDSQELIVCKRNLEATEALFIKAFYEYEVCTMVDTTTDALVNLEKQQSNLRQQQLALEKKAKDLKETLEAQKIKEEQVKKEDYINANESVINKNVKDYNNVLKTCGCEEQVFKAKKVPVSQLKSVEMEKITLHYLDKVISISENYIAKLNACKNRKNK